MQRIGTTPISTTMTQVSIAPALLPYAGDPSNMNIWGVDASGNIYKYASGSTWTQISGNLKQVSVAADGTVWGVSSQNLIYQYAGNNAWNTISGSLVQVAVGSASQIWGVNALKQIYQYQGNNSWNQISGSLTQISVAADGTVCGVNAAGNAYLYQGNNSWTQLPGSNQNTAGTATNGTFVQVVAASTQLLYALFPTGDIYMWHNPANAATPWDWGGFPAAKYLSTGSDGGVALIDPTGTTQYTPSIVG